MSRTLSTIVFYGYTFTENEAALIDQAEAYTKVGEGSALEWRGFGGLEFKDTGMALAVTESIREEYNGTPVCIGAVHIELTWARLLIKYLESIEVKLPEPTPFPAWWAVGSYG